jgi:tripartite-type tricarboxylate transporter receptor subunit TctC
LPPTLQLASALHYPTRPVHVIVGFPEGSGPNVVAHIVGEQIFERLGQQFVVESRPAAGSSIVAEYVAKAIWAWHQPSSRLGSSQVN